MRIASSLLFVAALAASPAAAQVVRAGQAMPPYGPDIRIGASTVEGDPEDGRYLRITGLPEGATYRSLPPPARDAVFHHVNGQLHVEARCAVTDRGRLRQCAIDRRTVVGTHARAALAAFTATFVLVTRDDPPQPFIGGGRRYAFEIVAADGTPGGDRVSELPLLLRGVSTPPPPPPPPPSSPSTEPPS